MDRELIQKAKAAKSPEELLALAKENGYPIDEDGAKELFAQLQISGELSDDELTNVAGGGCQMLHVQKVKCKRCGAVIYKSTRSFDVQCPYCLMGG